MDQDDRQHKNIHFHPDLGLYLKRSCYIPSRTQLALLHVIYSAYLVLKEVSASGIPRARKDTRQYRDFLRTGVLRVPGGKRVLYKGPHWTKMVAVK